MQEMRTLILFVMLAICSIDDLYTKKVNIVAVFVMGAIALLLNAGINMYGIFPGLMLYVFSKLKRSIGEADGIIFMVLGAATDMKNIFEVLFFSLVLASLYSLFLLIAHKKERSYTFAFVPFILFAFCFVNMRNKYKTGSMTIELSLIMPGIMAVIILIIFMGYYLHDKCVIKRAAYIACLREADAYSGTLDEGSMLDIFEKSTDEKLLGKWQLNNETHFDSDKISMNVSGIMESPVGLLNGYVRNPVFSVNMDVYSYIKP